MQQAVRDAYERLNGSPITAAAKLALGEDVPDRTTARVSAMGPAPARRVPTTARPVMLSSGALSSLSARAKKAVIGVAGAAVLLLVILLVAGASGHSPPPAAAAPVSVPSAPVATVAPRSSASVVALSPVVAPEVSFDELAAPPAASAHPPSRSPTPGHAHAASSGTPSPAASPPSQCQPPFVIDPTTGKKRWKLECL
jgi:hypothetical protein